MTDRPTDNSAKVILLIPKHLVLVPDHPRKLRVTGLEDRHLDWSAVVRLELPR